MIEIADEGNSGGRPARDPRIQAFAGQGLQATLLRQDQFGYAGDDEDPRPVPKRTLGSLKREFEAYREAGGPRPEVHAPLGFYLAFCSDRVEVAAEDAIPVPKEDLWWLAAPDDLLLLSDRVTHHYTTVHRVGGGRIWLLDDWPERIFLKAGMNAAGVEAVVAPYFAGVFDAVLPQRKEVGITEAEYRRVVVGLITQDTPALFERYVAHRPAMRDDHRFNLAAGLALMDVGRDELARFAIPYLARALSLAPQPARARCAAALYVALQVAGRRAGGVAGGSMPRPYGDSLGALLAEFDEAALVAGLDAERLCRLGNAAAWGQDFDAAQRCFDAVLARDADDEHALWLRAKVHLRRENAAAALQDGSAALAANQARIRARQQQRDTRDRRDRWGRMDDDARINGLCLRRAEQLCDRARAWRLLDRASDAMADARAAIAVAPDCAEAYSMLAGAALAADEPDAALAALREGIARARDPKLRGRMVLVRERLQAAARDSSAVR
ncbi:MAG: hypothetical protein KDG52_13215 [Rhodocyclaceae bacterium]|nr:hypothetical protein [Rhodocyclaceae bacterium]